MSSSTQSTKTAPTDFPHNFISEINAASHAEYGFSAFDRNAESDMCREYTGLLSGNIPEREAKEMITQLIIDLKQTTILAQLTTKQLHQMKDSGASIEEFDDFLHNYNAGSQEQKSPSTEGLTCLHGKDKN